MEGQTYILVSRPGCAVERKRPISGRTNDVLSMLQELKQHRPDGTLLTVVEAYSDRTISAYSSGEFVAMFGDRDTSIGAQIAKYMRKEGHKTLCWGDGALVNAVADHTRVSHPLNKMHAALAAMERRPDLFSKHFIRGHDKNGNPRKVRAFKLIDTES